MRRTSAGLYYFSSKLAPPKYVPLASWVTGWANVTGQVALVCSIDYTWLVVFLRSGTFSLKFITQCTNDHHCNHRGLRWSCRARLWCNVRDSISHIGGPRRCLLCCYSYPGEAEPLLRGC